jgi:hypothetical protein
MDSSGALCPRSPLEQEVPTPTEAAPVLPTADERAPSPPLALPPHEPAWDPLPPTGASAQQPPAVESVLKQLVDENLALKREADIAERTLVARNERIQYLDSGGSPTGH